MSLKDCDGRRKFTIVFFVVTFHDEKRIHDTVPNGCDLVIDSRLSRHNQNQKGPVLIQQVLGTLLSHIKRFSSGFPTHPYGITTSLFKSSALIRVVIDMPTMHLQRLLTSMTMMESVLLLLSAGAVHLSLSPPNPPVNKCECYFDSEKERKSSFFEIFIQSITWCSKVSPCFIRAELMAENKSDDDVDRVILQSDENHD